VNNERTLTEVADIFRYSGDKYLKNNRLTKEQRKAIYDIRSCRTVELGGHTTSCSACGIIDISYNSCRNRNCPKCGFQKKIKWLYLRKKDVLPITYYHVVFTIPQEMNPFFLIQTNQKLMYGLFFQAVSKTIELLAGTDKFYCGRPGMIAILHTWGQTLSFHPHIHCILTGGGLDIQKGTWIDKMEFLFPVKVLARLFRRIFLGMLYSRIMEGKINLPYSLLFENGLQNFLTAMKQKDWIAYCKQPFDNPCNLIEYLGRYTHRIAISNHRIQSVTEDKVSFCYKDYRDGKSKVMELYHEEFIRRFLLHVVPSGFMRIRYYGILSNPCRKILLPICRRLLRDRMSRLEPLPDTWKSYYFQITGQEFGTCKHCKVGTPVIIFDVPVKARDSPKQ